MVSLGLVPITCIALGGWMKEEAKFIKKHLAWCIAQLCRPAKLSHCTVVFFFVIRMKKWNSITIAPRHFKILQEDRLS